MKEMTKEKAIQALKDAIDMIEKEPWPDEVKADSYRMIAQLAFLHLSNVHAGFIDSVIACQQFISKTLVENMKRYEEKVVDVRRDKLHIVKAEDLN